MIDEMGKTNKRFSMRLAEGWEDQTVHLFVGPAERGMNHHLTIAVDDIPLAETAQDYAEYRVEQFLDTLPAAEVLKEEPLALGEDLDAYEVVIKFVPSEAGPRFRRLVFVLHENTAFTFAADFTKVTRNTLGAQMIEMIKTFRPEAGA